MSKEKLKKDGTPSRAGEGGGRPMKIDAWSKKLQELLSEKSIAYIKDKPVIVPFNASVLLTDDCLVSWLNDELDPNDEINISTFDKWKARDWDAVEDKDKKEKGKRFLQLYKKALAHAQKQMLSALAFGENQWQSRAWLLERKFVEWNLKKLSEVDQKVSGGITINTNANTSRD